jgi:hypothetical protein
MILENCILKEVFGRRVGLVMGIEDEVREEKLLVIMMIEGEITVLIYIFYVA